MVYVPFKFFSKNIQGRDFVVGDIHGCFSALENLLAQVNFNPEYDRVFTVALNSLSTTYRISQLPVVFCDFWQP